MFQGKRYKHTSQIHGSLGPELATAIDAGGLKFFKNVRMPRVINVLVCEIFYCILCSTHTCTPICSLGARTHTHLPTAHLHIDRHLHTRTDAHARLHIHHTAQHVAEGGRAKGVQRGGNWADTHTHRQAHTDTYPYTRKSIFRLFLANFC